MCLFTCRTNKKERALQAFYIEAHANRWMGALRTTHNGLTAYLYSNGFAQNVKDKKAGEGTWGQIFILDSGKETKQDKMKNVRRQGIVGRTRPVIRGGMK